MLSGSLFVRMVTVIHTIVVTSVVVRTSFANSTVSEPVKIVGRPATASATACECKASVSARAVIIAEISLHALMRHQYQRSMYTLPVPAPTCSTTCHPERIDARSEISAMITALALTLALHSQAEAEAVAG